MMGIDKGPYYKMIQSKCIPKGVKNRARITVKSLAEISGASESAILSKVGVLIEAIVIADYRHALANMPKIPIKEYDHRKSKGGTNRG